MKKSGHSRKSSIERKAAIENENAALKNEIKGLYVSGGWIIMEEQAIEEER